MLNIARTTIIIAGLFVATCSSLAWCDTTADARRAILHAYQKADKALGQHDVEGTISADTFDTAGRNPADQDKARESVRRALKKWFASNQKIIQVTTILKFSCHGDRATVRAKYSSRVVVPEHPEAELSNPDRTCDEEWVRRNSVWRRVGWRVVTSNASVKKKGASTKAKSNSYPPR